MLDRIRSHLTFANAASGLALFVALATGSAYAANTVFSADIVDGQVKTPDLANLAVTTDKLAGGAVTSEKVKNDTLTGGDIAPNTLKGADIDEATLQGLGGGGLTTARAYGYVTRDGAIIRSKNVVGNATGEGGGPPADGDFCITLAQSIDADVAAIVPAPDFAHDDTSQTGGSVMAIVEADSNGSTDCAGNAVEVHTSIFFGDPLDDGVGGDVITELNQPFYFVVP